MEKLSCNRESQLWSNKLKIWSLFRSYQIICETCLLAAHMSVPPNLSGRRSQMMLAPNAYLTARSYYFQFPPRALSVVGWSSVTAPPPRSNLITILKSLCQNPWPHFNLHFSSRHCSQLLRNCSQPRPYLTEMIPRHELLRLYHIAWSYLWIALWLLLNMPSAYYINITI